MVIDENLPLGIMVNTAAIMGITFGEQMPEVMSVIKAVREKLYEPEFLG